MTSKPLRILIADDHEMVRRGLQAVLAGRPGWEICGEATTGREAVELSAQLDPDIVILDITMPELNGLEACREIRKVSPRSEVLILTMHDSEQLVREALAAGARGYVLKNDVGRVLVLAVETLSENRPYFTSKVAGLLLEQFLHPSRPAGPTEPVGTRRLTARERQIIQLVAEGRTNKEIALVLNISVRTAETHRLNLMRKLGLHSASELTRYAIRNQIISP